MAFQVILYASKVRHLQMFLFYASRATIITLKYQCILGDGMCFSPIAYLGHTEHKENMNTLHKFGGSCHRAETRYRDFHPW
jgi:hypothetical protein